MAKKLKGNFFFLTANDLQTGKVVYFTDNGWSLDIKYAKKITRNDIEKYQNIGEESQKKCIIVSPFFIELNDCGEIITIRDKIRLKGLTFKL